MEIIRKDYGEPMSAYGCLGVLQVAQGKEVFHYLVLITDCQSVGKVQCACATSAGLINGRM